MIYRFMFAGYSDNVHSVKILEGHDCYVALSGSAGKVFMYVESRQETVEPEMLATGELIPYPNGKKWESQRDLSLFQTGK